MAQTITAAASVATLVVLTAAAVAALIQLRHMHTSNQLQAFLDLYNRANQPDVMRLFDFVLLELPHVLANDPQYVQKVVRREIPSSESPLRVAFWFDEVGIVLRRRLVPPEMIFQVGASAYATVTAWTTMRPLIEALRERSAASFLHFEYAAALAKQWIDAHPTGDYPRNAPRWSDVAH